MPVEVFHRWSPEHWAALAVMALCVVGAIKLGRGRSDTGPATRRAALCLAVILVLREAAKMANDVHKGTFTIETGLPLQACDLTLIAAVVALLTRNQFAYEITYFFGLGATPQALVTPDLRHPFPSLDYWLFFVGHGGIVVAVALLTAAMGLRPTRSSVVRVFAAGLVYIGVVGAFDVLASANYGYLCHKPNHASLFDHLGPWPWYVVFTYLIGGALVLLLYVPFEIVDRVRTRRG